MGKRSKTNNDKRKSKAKKTLFDKILEKINFKRKKSKTKKKKGFTLIELLAVIVILGLLMAIAIPSVTKYITESRKKTVVSTIGNYIGALVNDVNDLSYTFTEENTVYAVPIECIALERGGTNPFGAWHQANDSYFAYVLVQYNDDTSSYTYGYTFKDSAGYGMYPTSQAKLNEQGKQIKTGLDIKRPTNGTIANITEADNWNGFDVDSSTDLVVLVAESEGNIGDGINTCTLQQKGDNYAQAEEEKETAKVEAVKDYTLMETTENGTNAFWGYKSKIKTVTFQDSINIPSNIGLAYKWDVSSSGNGQVMAYITPNSSDSKYYDLYIQGDGKLYANRNSSYLFYRFEYLDTINNANILDTSYVNNMSNMFGFVGSRSKISNMDLSDWNVSKVTDMSNMFLAAGYNEFNVTGLNNWDTSNVLTMERMFGNIGYNAKTFDFDLSGWNTSNVRDMRMMFDCAGYNSSTFNLNLSNWNTSNVNDMGSMFHGAGYDATSWNISGLSDWNTAKVTDMAGMFSSAGQKATTFTLNLNNWNVSSVTDMSSMFENFGRSATTLTLDLSNWRTSNATNMNKMFYNAGRSSAMFTFDLSDWNTSNVTNMSSIFANAGYNASTFDLDLSNWNTQKVTDMSSMFNNAGYNATSWNISGLSNWNTSSVTNMKWMFNSAGMSANVFTFDLSNWNTSNVTDMSSMFKNAGYNAGTFGLDLSNWNTQKVTDMSSMFNNAGPNATSWNISGLSNWNTSNVTNMSNMFNSAGSKNGTFVLDLSNWNTSNVTNMAGMFVSSGKQASTWNVGNLNDWDTSLVTNMSNMFNSAGSNAWNWNVGNLSNWKTSNVTNMSGMFAFVGISDTSTLDCSTWDVNKVTSYSNFDSGDVELRITPPKWVN